MRFVVLRHTGVDRPHFDLMFETAADALLTTWRSPIWPIAAPQPLERAADHRRIYLEFEGELSENRGRVERVASGACAIERHDGETFWSIRFSAGMIAPLNIRQIAGEQWLAVPSCGG